MFTDDTDKQKAPKYTPQHVPIALKTDDGKMYHAMVKKEDVKKIQTARGIKATDNTLCPQDTQSVYLKAD